MADYTFGEIDRNECIGNSLSTININFAQLTENLTDLQSKLLAVSADSLASVKEIVPGANVLVSETQGSGVVTISSVSLPAGGVSLIRDAVLSAVNVGGTGASVFKRKAPDRALEFRRIASGGSNVVIQQEEDLIKITAFDRRNAADLGEINTSSNAGSGVGLVMPKVGANLPFKTILPGTGVTISEQLSSITLNASFNIQAQSTGTGASLLATTTPNTLTFKSLTSGSSNVRIDTTTNEVKISVVESLSAYNTGQGASLYKEKDVLNNRLIFKTLSAGSNTLQSWPYPNNSPCNIQITETADKVLFTVSDKVSGSNTTFSGNGGRVFKEKTGNTMEYRSIIGQGQVQVTESPGAGNNIVVSLIGNTNVLSAVADGTNLGTGAQIYKQKTGPYFVFRTLSAGSGIEITQQDNTLTLNANLEGVTGSGILTGSNIGYGVGLVDSVAGAVLRVKSLSTVGSNLSIVNNPTTNTVVLSVQGLITGAQNNPNIFSGSQSLYEGQAGNLLQFKKLLPGTGISLQETTGHIIINSTQTEGITQDYSSSTDYFKNKLINGNLDIWQWQKSAYTNLLITPVLTKEISVSDTNNGTNLKFLADRFGFYAGQAASGPTVPEAVLTKLNIPLTAVAYNGPLSASKPSYGIRVSLGTRATSTLIPTRLIQRIENVKLLAGKQVVVSFWARSNNAGTNAITISHAQCYKASIVPIQNGFISPPIIAATINLTNDWQRHYATFTLPPISQTSWNAIWLFNDEDSSWDSFTQLSFDLSGSNGRFIDFASFQLEEGSIPTAFERRSPALELTMCERYYETGNKIQTQFSGSASNSNNTYTSFKTQKRTAPTMIAEKSVLLKNNISSITNVNITDHTYSTTYTDGFTTQYTGTGNAVNSKPFIYNWAASAEF